MRPDLAELSNTTFLKWFVAVNLGVVLTTVWFLPGLIWAFPIIGVGGAFLSLLLSKWLAKRAHDIEVINPARFKSPAEEHLYRTVAELAGLAGLKRVPEVGVYDSPDVNAFATGGSRDSSLVAFSGALLRQLPPDQIRAVAAHEIGHVANRDMLAMVALQGVVNSIVLLFTFPLNFLRLVNLFSDSFSWVVEIVLWVIKTIAVFVLTLIGSLFVKAYSRRREYRADTFAARLVGPETMAAALTAIAGDETAIPRGQMAYATLKIAGRPAIFEWFSTHPSIDKRIAALKAGASAGELDPAPHRTYVATHQSARITPT
jgi:heat shock protein HtpX